MTEHALEAQLRAIPKLINPNTLKRNAYEIVSRLPERLEAVSKLPEQDHHAPELHKPLKVLDISFVSHDQSSVVV